MKTIRASRTLAIPEEVSLTTKGRKVRVKGPRGVIVKDFSHLKVDLIIGNKGRELKAEVWFGNRAELACIRTVISHIRNMITGVTKGYKYKMRMVYAHFPISVTIEDNGKRVEVRNYIGEKLVRSVPMIGDTVCARGSGEVKDEIVLTGTDVNAVSQSAANIQQCARVSDKDIRKFLDGVYVSNKGTIVSDE